MLNAMMFSIEPIYKILEIPKFLEMVNFVEQEVNPEEWRPFSFHLSRRKYGIEDGLIGIFDY
jgi:hypothetical protein